MKKLSFPVRPLMLAALFTLTAGTAEATQVIVVTPTPGNPTQSGNDLLAAYNGITNNAWGRRYLVQVEPGVYDLGTQNLVMKQWVSLAGSGREATFIYGFGNTDAQGLDRGLIEGADNVVLRDLTIRSYPTTGRENLIPIYLDGVSPRIENVGTQAFNAAATSTDVCYGILGIDTVSTIADVGVNTSCGNGFTAGMEFQGSSASPRILRTSILANNGGSSNGVFGISATSDAALAELRDSSIVAAGGEITVGLVVGGIGQTTPIINTTIIGRNGSVTNLGISSGNVNLDIQNSTVQALGTGIDQIGILHGSSSATVSLENGLVEGSTATINTSAGQVRIGGSRMAGGAVVGTVTCAGVYDENFTFSANTCP